jgi:HAD superfamily phosphoserine phosphatase-like hydrolase
VISFRDGRRPAVPDTGSGCAKLALLDVDGTLTREHSVWQFLMERSGRWSGAGEVNLERFLAGQWDYEEFCHADAALLKDLSYQTLQDLAHSVPMYEGLDELFDCLDSRGYHVVLLSTGLRLLTTYFTSRYRIAACHVNDLDARHGVCTGRALVEVVHGKAAHTRQVVDRFRPAHVVAMGDTSGDLPMFAAAHTSIAVNARDPRVLQATNVHFSGSDLAEVCSVL